MKHTTLIKFMLLPLLLLVACSPSQKTQGKTLQEWMQDLRAPDEALRLKAVRVLAVKVRNTVQIRQMIDPQWVEALEGALRDRRPDVRLEAALALAWVGQDSGLTVPVLLEAMRDSGIQALHQATSQAVLHHSRTVESSLAFLLRLMEPRLPGLLPIGAAQLSQRNPSLAQKTVAATVDKLSRATETASMVTILDELSRNGQAAPALAIPAATRPLKHADASVRAAAARTLGSFGSFGFPALQALAESLQGDPDPRVRAAAALAIMHIDPRTGSTVYTIYTALSDSDPLVRAAAARALGDFGPSARAITQSVSADLLKDIIWPHNLALHVIEPAIGPLLGALRDPDVRVRVEAARTLGRISPVVEKVLPGLLETLGDVEPAVRGAAAWSVGELAAGQPKVRERLEPLLKDADPAVRGAALLAIVKLATSDVDVLPLLLQAARDAAPEVQWAFLRSLLEIGPAVIYDSKPLADGLLALARHADPRLRAAALLVLGRTELRGGPAMQELIRGLEDKSPDVVQAAADALSWLGPLAAQATPALDRLRRKSDVRFQLTGTMALGWIDRESTETLPAILKAARQPDFWRMPAADETTSDSAAALLVTLAGGPAHRWREMLLMLGWRGPDAWSSAPVVAGLMREARNPLEMRFLAGMTLVGLSSQTLPTQIPPIFEQIRSSYRQRQLQAAAGLVWLGEKAAPALPELLRFLQSDSCDPDLRIAAAAAIGKMGPSAARAVPDLCIAMRQEDDPRVKAAVAAVLGGLGLSGKTATSSLIAALKDSDAAVREASALALGKIGLDGQFAVPALLGTLGDSEPRVRLASALALRGYGPLASAAQGPLQTLAASDADPLVRKAALGSLKKIAKE